MNHSGKCIGGPRNGWIYDSNSISLQLPHHYETTPVDQHCAKITKYTHLAVYLWSATLQAWVFEGIIEK